MTIAASDFEFLATLVNQRTGNVLKTSQDYLLESRLGGVVRQLGLPSLDSLVLQLRSNRDAQLIDQVAEAMTINETSFFREPYAFETLRQHILPDLIAARRSTKRLSMWSAACSSGQEPYSVAILLKEHFPELDDWQVEFRCTDYSQQMVDRARRGTYTQFEVNRGLPAQLLVKYFDRTGMRWEVKEHLRRNMSFQTCNLTEPWPRIGTFDLVMLRNVLIYFDKSTKERVFSQMHRTIASDGYLLLGGGETTINLATEFRSVLLDKSAVLRPGK